jgi:hypothetical protein
MTNQLNGDCDRCSLLMGGFEFYEGKIPGIRKIDEFSEGREPHAAGISRATRRGALG